MINVMLGANTDGRKCVALVLSQDDMFADLSTGEPVPRPGAALTASEARQLAFKLLLHAELIDHPSEDPNAAAGEKPSGGG